MVRCRRWASLLLDACVTCGLSLLLVVVLVMCWFRRLCSPLFGVVGCVLLLLVGVARCCWLLLVVGRCCWLLLRGVRVRRGCLLLVVVGCLLLLVLLCVFVFVLSVLFVVWLV